MRIEEFDFELPEEAIARYPAERRDASRLMVVDRARGTIEHRSFAELPSLIAADDLLVVNDTRVLAARLDAKKETGGRVEILLVEPAASDPLRPRTAPGVPAAPGPREDRAQSTTSLEWRAMVNASKSVRAGSRLVLGDGSIVSVISEEGDGFVVLGLPRPASALASELGEIPLPPYLRRRAEVSDRARYQTVYARGEERSVAAPTAGLHFTPELLARLPHTAITLHVGPGTFLPVRVEVIEEHRMHAERYEVSAAAAAAINDARGRVIAVGTTATRVLESVGRPVQATRGATDLFVRPGYTFRAVDAMITNFHLPRSTLLMLVSAFAGRELILSAYREAIACGYRFFSYGDAMLIS